MNMLGLAKRTGARVLQASTSEVYGDPEVSPQTEAYWGHVNTIGVRSCYDEGKRVSETLCFDYMRSHNVDIRVARIFNTYGPGMHPYDGRVVTNFIMQALHNEDITLYGDGQQTRSFTYVDDTVDGLIKLMEQEQTVGPMNLGNPNEFTVRQLAELVIEMTGSKSKIINMPLPGDDPKQRRPDITRARTCMNWEPSTQLREASSRPSSTSGPWISGSTRSRRTTRPARIPTLTPPRRSEPFLFCFPCVFLSGLPLGGILAR